MMIHCLCVMLYLDIYFFRLGKKVIKTSYTSLVCLSLVTCVYVSELLETTGFTLTAARYFAFPIVFSVLSFHVFLIDLCVVISIISF